MYLQTQPDCSPICISTDFILISTRFTHVKEDFEDTKGVIRFRISKKNRQHNGQKKKYKRVVQGIRMAQNIEESFDASSAHKMHVLIANYQRYVKIK
jgi:hypothetical protein